MDKTIMYKGYCMRCKKPSTMKNAAEVKMPKTGAPAVKGECVKCSCKMFKILPKVKK